MTLRPDLPPDRSNGATDNPEELFDLVDEQDVVIGQVTRGEAHSNPALLHRSVQTLVFDSAGRVLLQLRSARKDLYPHYYCASASGHVIAGDTYEATARRELAEELGVSATVTFLGTALVRSPLESEMTALFVAHSDGPLRFDRIETDGGAFFTWDALREARVSLPMTPALHVALDEVERRMAAGEFVAPS